MAPRPSESYLAKFYSEAPGYSEDALEGYERILKREWDAILSRIARALPSGRRVLLDFGCSDGSFLAHAASMGFESLGYEPTEHLASIARGRRSGPIFSAHRLSDVPIAPGSVDAIHCAHVLEHVASPVDVVRWFWRVLRPGGVAVVQVPNQFGDVLWPFLHDRWLRNGRALGYHLHHLQFFTVTSLAQLFARCDFSISKLDTAFIRGNRRLVDQGARRSVRIAKRVLYAAAGRIGRGPHIEIWARKPS